MEIVESLAASDANRASKSTRLCQRCNMLAKASSILLTLLLLLVTFSPRGALAQPGSKDWIDPVFSGNGVRPPNDTTIFMSVFLNRLMDVDEVSYKFKASYWFFLSWRDERAFQQVAEATAAIAANPDKQCERLCNRQKAQAPGALCCDTVWLPTIIFRNVDELPQGRTQPSYINVLPDGAVTWRVEARIDLFTTLDLSAFPFDIQTLDAFLQIISDGSQSKVLVKPSATGTKLFVAGAGDDLSRFTVRALRIYAREPEPWSNQFDDPSLKNLQTYSDPADPAPLVPRPPPEILEARARARKRGGSATQDSYVDPRAFGSNFTSTDVVISILISRNSLYDALNIILPVVVCTIISILTFFVEPDKLDTRLQIVITLFLALVAIQFVVENDLPSSSYVLPTRQHVILSYFVLLLVALEALVVYNVKSWVNVRQWFSGMKRARRERAVLVEAQQQQQRRERERQALLATGSTAPRGGGLGRKSKAAGADSTSSPSSVVGASVPTSAFATATSASAPEASKDLGPSAAEATAATAAPAALEVEDGGRGGATTASVRDGALGAPRRSLGQYLTFSRSFVPPTGTPWSWGRRGAGVGGGRVGGRGVVGGNGYDASAAVAGGTAEALTPSTAALPPRLARDDPLSASMRRRRREAVERQLDEDVRASWYSWVAWRIDMTCAVVLSIVYVLVTILIFVIGVARAPSECELSGQDRALCESAKAALKSHGVDPAV